VDSWIWIFSCSPDFGRRYELLIFVKLFLIFDYIGIIVIVLQFMLVCSFEFSDIGGKLRIGLVTQT
jgi:hypothetical protein